MEQSVSGLFLCSDGNSSSRFLPIPNVFRTFVTKEKTYKQHEASKAKEKPRSALPDRS